MKNSNQTLKLSLLFLSVLLIATAKSNAQSNIVAMPSTDILSKGTVGVRLGFKFKFNDEPAKKRFSSFTPRVIFGVSKNVEVGLNVLGNTQPGADTTTLVPTVKWRIYGNEKSGVAIVMGSNLYIPVRNKKYNLGTYSYALASKVIRKTKTRLTFGGYFYSKNVTAANANRAGGQFAIEQPISKKVSFATEFVTGKHANGYVMPAFKIKLHKQFVTKIGYVINNSKAAKGNHFFYAAVDINFHY